MAGVSPTVTPIVALDFSTMDAALGLVDDLGDRCTFYKVGSELFTATGPAMVAALSKRGAAVFLDLKLHDIPNTVNGAARSAAALGARLLTVHASGGSAMLKAAVAGAREGGDCGILAVTVLTSFDGGSLSDVWGRRIASVEDEVMRLAQLAADAGAHGIVCSGKEGRGGAIPVWRTVGDPRSGSPPRRRGSAGSGAGRDAAGSGRRWRSLHRPGAGCNSDAVAACRDGDGVRGLVLSGSWGYR